MARKQITIGQQQFLESTLSHLTAWIQDRAPYVGVEVTFEQYEDEDAHVYIHPPLVMTTEEIEQLELAVGEHCNEILLDSGLFIVSAVCG